jgi:hypothetical protein
MNYTNSKPKVAQKSQRITFSNKNPRIFCIFPPFAASFAMLGRQVLKFCATLHQLLKLSAACLQ